jgi:hypothetical protein
MNAPLFPREESTSKKVGSYLAIFLEKKKVSVQPSAFSFRQKQKIALPVSTL